MKQIKKLKGSEALGVTFKISKELDKYSGKVLFPKKLAKANKMLKGVKIP